MSISDMETTFCLSVVSHGHGALLHRLLSQMDAQPSLAGVRVILTLNLPDEIFDPSPYKRLDLHVIRNTTSKGFGANHNAAFSLCTSAWYGILNPDLAFIGDEPFTGILERAVNHQKKDTVNVGIIAPLVVANDLIPEDSVRPNLTPLSLACRVIGLGYNSPLSTQTQRGSSFFWVAGMCMLVRADMFSSLGGFDERFFLYCEDYDLCARAYNAGWGIHLDKQATIIHEAQRASHRTGRYLRMHLSSLVKVWFSSAYWRVTLSIFISHQGGSQSTASSSGRELPRY